MVAVSAGLHALAMNGVSFNYIATIDAFLAADKFWHLEMRVVRDVDASDVRTTGVTEGGVSDSIPGVDFATA
jgi:hypothetical protein